jgi:hypothetical protein
MNILNGTEAFAAMSAGQKIECRHIGSDLDFDEIRNFPATVFIDQDYAFRIAVVYMMIGSMQVPESIFECPGKGTQCYTPSILTTELSKAFKWKNSDADLSLLSRGLVHLYEENAVTHASALIAVSRGSVAQPKAESSIDDLPWLEPASDQNSTSNDVVKKTSTCQSEIEITAQGSIAAVEESLTEFEVEEAPKRDLVHEALLEDLLNRAANAKTPAEANALVGYTRMWSEAQRKPLLDAIHKRLNELESMNAGNEEKPPLILSQIETAADLTTLDCLEIEIAGRHVGIQPLLTKALNKRRAELESQSSEVAS